MKLVLGGSGIAILSGLSPSEIQTLSCLQPIVQAGALAGRRIVLQILPANQSAMSLISAEEWQEDEGTILVRGCTELGEVECPSDPDDYLHLIEWLDMLTGCWGPVAGFGEPDTLQPAVLVPLMAGRPIPGRVIKPGVSETMVCLAPYLPTGTKKRVFRPF
jgi:hypothetical protein